MPYNFFISYRNSGKPHVKAIADFHKSLEERGLSVFRDETGVEDFNGITNTITGALSQSNGFICCLTDDYTSSRACLWEATAAYIAAKNLGIDPTSCIFPINLCNDNDKFKETLESLFPELKDSKMPSSLGKAIDKLTEKAREITTCFGNGHLIVPDIVSTEPKFGSPLFVGRLKKMASLHQKLNSAPYVMTGGVARQEVVQIIGMGGTGKTLLAEEYALRFAAAYPGGIFWLSAYGSYNVDSPEIDQFRASRLGQHEHIAKHFGLNPRDYKDEGEDRGFARLRAEIKLKLDAQHKPALWIVDDMPLGLLDHSTDVQNWLSPSTYAKTLVTTRSTEYEHILGERVDLDSITLDDTRDLFTRHLVSHDGLEDLRTYLGSLTLALVIAASAMKADGTTPRDYLKELREDNKDLLEPDIALKRALPHNHVYSIIGTFKSSLMKLPDAAQNFMRLASCLARHPIDREMAASIFAGAFDLDENGSRKMVRHAFEGCSKWSLATGEGPTRQVHALVADTVRYLKLHKDERGLKLQTAAAQHLSRRIQPDLDHIKTTNLMLEVDHAAELLIHSDFSITHELFAKVADFHYFRGFLKLAKKDWETIFQKRKELLGPDHPDTLTSMNNLASTLKAMGDHKGAKELEVHVLERRKELLGPDHPDTLTTINNLAGILSGMNDSAGAKVLLEELLSRYKELLGHNHPVITITAFNLFATLDSLELYEDAKIVLSNDLLWLLDKEVTALSDEQQQIAEIVRRIVTPAK